MKSKWQSLDRSTVVRTQRTHRLYHVSFLLPTLAAGETILTEHTVNFCLCLDEIYQNHPATDSNCRKNRSYYQRNSKREHLGKETLSTLVGTLPNSRAVSIPVSVSIKQARKAPGQTAVPSVQFRLPSARSPARWSLDHLGSKTAGSLLASS